MSESKLISWLNNGFQRVVLYGVDYLGAPRDVYVDDDGALKNIDTIHSHIHAGQLFIAGHTFAAVASAASVDLVIEAPASPKQIHFAFDASASAGGRVSLYKDPTYTGGTPITPLNMNGNSVNTADAVVRHTPSVSAAGTLLPLGGVVPGGSGGNAAGGSNSDLARGIEIIASYSSKYLLRFTNDSSQAENVSIQFGFYEKTPS